MSDAKVDELIRVESQLTRSFVGAVAALLATVIWTMFIVRRTPTGAIEHAWLGLVLLPLQLGFYVWYAKSAGAAATALGDTGWKYIVWVLVAPLLALLPIPIVSTLLNASPLAIKFLLGGRLQTAIRQESFADFHAGQGGGP